MSYRIETEEKKQFRKFLATFRGQKQYTYYYYYVKAEEGSTTKLLASYDSLDRSTDIKENTDFSQGDSIAQFFFERHPDVVAKYTYERRAHLKIAGFEFDNTEDYENALEKLRNKRWLDEDNVTVFEKEGFVVIDIIHKPKGILRSKLKEVPGMIKEGVKKMPDYVESFKLGALGGEVKFRKRDEEKTN